MYGFVATNTQQELHNTPVTLHTNKHIVLSSSHKSKRTLDHERLPTSPTYPAWPCTSSTISDPGPSRRSVSGDSGKVITLLSTFPLLSATPSTEPPVQVGSTEAVRVCDMCVSPTCRSQCSTPHCHDNTLLSDDTLGESPPGDPAAASPLPCKNPFATARPLRRAPTTSTRTRKRHLSPWAVSAQHLSQTRSL